MQISGFYRVKKHPPHSKRGGCFFMFVKILNLMTLAERPVHFYMTMLRSCYSCAWASGRTTSGISSRLTMVSICSSLEHSSGVKRWLARATTSVV